jgi:hypothetical protein
MTRTGGCRVALGEILWFRKTPPKGAELELLRQFNNYGIHIANPASGRVVILDESGDVSLESNVLPEIERQWPLNVKLWLDADVDVIVTFYSVSEMGVIELDLDGLTAEQAERVVVAAFWTALKDPQSLAVVLDSRLPESAEFWETYIRTGKEKPLWRPEVLWERTKGAVSTVTMPPGSWLNHQDARVD